VSSTLNGGDIYLAVCVLSAIAGGWIGHRKGSSFFVWFLISGVLPLLGPIAALCFRRETEEALRVCPGCGAAVKLYDSMCMSCGTDLDYPDEAEIIEPTPALSVRARL
jgi:hypothetical protein